jgi:hypothetical protein
MNEEYNLKVVAKTLGKRWVYKNHPVENKLGPKMKYTGYESATFELNEVYICLSRQFHDPDGLHIGTNPAVDLEISFGPVTCFHFQQHAEPEVIIESMIGERVNFLEITSEGKIRIYHYFRRESYRPHLKHKKSI